MGCRYSPQRSRSNGESKFQNELTNQKFDSNLKLNLAYRQHHNVKPANLFHFQYVLQEAKQFWSLKRPHHYGIFLGCHHGTGTGSDHRQDDCYCDVFVISENTKLFIGLCNINEWWRGHRSHTLACYGRDFVCHVTYLPISPQGRPRFEFSYRGNLQQPVESKIVRTKKIITCRTPQSNLPTDCWLIGLAMPGWVISFVGFIRVEILQMDIVLEP